MKCISTHSSKSSSGTHVGICFLCSAEHQAAIYRSISNAMRVSNTQFILYQYTQILFHHSVLEFSSWIVCSRSAQGGKFSHNALCTGWSSLHHELAIYGDASWTNSSINHMKYDKMHQRAQIIWHRKFKSSNRRLDAAKGERNWIVRVTIASLDVTIFCSCETFFSLV